MKYELENRDQARHAEQGLGTLRPHPDLTAAAKSGTPQMEAFESHGSARACRPSAAGNGGGLTNTVTVETPANPDMLDKNPDARMYGPRRSD